MAAIPDFSLDLAEETLEEMREKNHNKNTVKSTRTWLKVFDAWRDERGEPRKLAEIPVEELDGVPCRFVFKI